MVGGKTNVARKQIWNPTANVVCGSGRRSDVTLVIPMFTQRRYSSAMTRILNNLQTSETVTWFLYVEISTSHDITHLNRIFTKFLLAAKYISPQQCIQGE